MWVGVVEMVEVGVGVGEMVGVGVSVRETGKGNMQMGWR
jgi:hypothetical protein